MKLTRKALLGNTRKLLGLLGLVGVFGATVGAGKSPLPSADLGILEDRVGSLERTVKTLAGDLEDSKRDHDSLKARVHHLEQMRRIERSMEGTSGPERDNKKPAKE